MPVEYILSLEGFRLQPAVCEQGIVEAKEGGMSRPNVCHVCYAITAKKCLLSLLATSIII